MFSAMEEEYDKLQSKIDYYEGLIDYLYDHVPCMDELIALYDEGLGDE